MRIRVAAGGVAALLLALAGCATAPVRPAAQWIGVLPDDASLYLSVDVQASADVLAAALEGAGPDAREVGPLLERTERLYAAVKLAAGEPAKLSAVALGTFPAGLIRSRLCGSRAWKTVRTPSGKYYTNVKSGLEVGVPGRFAVLASAGAMEGLLARFALPVALPMPPEVADDMETADLLLYLPTLPGSLGAAPGTGAAGAVGASGASASAGSAAIAALPIREIWLEAKRDADRYLVSGACNTATDADARRVVLLMRLALVQWLRAQDLADTGERLKAVTLAAEGPRVKLGGLWFTKDELAPVLLGLAGGGAAAPGTAAEAAPAGSSP